MDIPVEYGHDYYLHIPGTILNGSGQPYQKFTPFYNTALKKKVETPSGLRKIHFSSITKHLQHIIKLDDALKRFTKINPDILVNGGRVNAIKQMKQAAINIKNYGKTRDELSHHTSELSAYIKFGSISIREVYKTFRTNSDFIRQLYWRDFYMSILYSFPNVLNHSLKPKYDKIKWNNNDTWFKKWCNGNTGFPVVDAAMRQLNITGYMVNRGRLIVASFLVKTLLISWKKGAKYFSQHLTDYDPASNQLNWQWVASSGPDSQPFFRIFNPWLQAENFDEDCIYIKTWVPELSLVDPKIIHNWETEWENNKDIKYPKPIVNYAEQKKKALTMYTNALH
jgi:deoxyribodipyrimidine photo-lyase